MATTDTDQKARPKTGAQFYVSDYNGQVSKPSYSTTLTETKKDQMLRHDAIAMPAAFSVAPIVAAEWVYESEIPEHAAYVEEQLAPHRSRFVEAAMWSEIRDGSSFFEKVFTPDGQLASLKWLKPCRTWVLRDQDTSEFKGLLHQDARGKDVYLAAEHSLFVSNSPDGGYAPARLLNAEVAYDEHLDLCLTASRHARKHVGGIWIMRYRSGYTPDDDGVDMHNQDIAEEQAANLQASGILVLPDNPLLLGEKVTQTFHVERIDPSSSMMDFVAGKKHGEERLARSMLVPSRAVNEGTYGTLAESQAQASVALQVMQLKAQWLAEVVTQYVVDQLLMLRFGVTGTVKICASPLDDEMQARLMALITKFLDDPGIGPEIADRLDIVEMLEGLGFSLRKDDEMPDLEELEEKKAANAPQIPGQEIPTDEQPPAEEEE